MRPSVIAYDENGAREPASVPVVWANHDSKPKAKFYVLAIGVTTYENESSICGFPTKDTQDFIKAIQDRSARLYASVIANPPPPGGNWTHDAVWMGLTGLRRAN